MNQQPVKSAFQPIRPHIDQAIAQKTPAPQKPAAPAGKITPAERLEKHLAGKFFYFVYAEGVKYRAGKIEAVVAENSIAIRYFSPHGKLQNWHHVVRLYDAARIDTLTGLWLYETEADLKADHGFLLDHIKTQEDLLAQQDQTDR